MTTVALKANLSASDYGAEEPLGLLSHCHAERNIPVSSPLKELVYSGIFWNELLAIFRFLIDGTCVRRAVCAELENEKTAAESGIFWNAGIGNIAQLSVGGSGMQIAVRRMVNVDVS